MGLVEFQSASRAGLVYTMAEVTDGVWCHYGEGCEREQFAGPYRCRHSKEMMGEEMTQALVTTQPRPMALRQFTDKEIDTIKATIAQGCTDEEVSLFIAAASTMDLNPFAREIYAIRRRSKQRVPGTNNWDWVEKMVITIGVDGYRKVAASGGLYAGQEGPFFSDDGEHWTEVWMKPKPPALCKVIVHGHGFKTPVTAIGRWDRYAPEPLQGQWKDAGPEMLAKCTEVLALRRAFPAQMQGLENVARDAGVVLGDPSETSQEPRTAPPAASEPQPDVSDGEYREIVEKIADDPVLLDQLQATVETLEKNQRRGRRSDDHDVMPAPEDDVPPWEEREPEPPEQPGMTIEEARQWVRNFLRTYHKTASTEEYAKLCRQIVNIAPGMHKNGKISAAQMTERLAPKVIELCQKAVEEPVPLDPENPTCCDMPNLAFGPGTLNLVCKKCGTVYP